MGTETLSVEQALERLQEVAPEAPFLALGQTVFWDEPMKAGVALASRKLGYSRRLVAGVHDTDYFAKLPSGRRQPGKFKTLPHNDTTTKGLWSAAGEFSSLFGSETVITREALASAGLRVDMLRRSRPSDFLDHATEAWGWRGIVSMDEHPPVTAELPLSQVFPELQKAFDWALDTSLACIGGQLKDAAQELADEIRTLLCDVREEDPQASLAGFYRRLLPDFYRLCSNSNVDIETTATTELLRFNTLTACHPRFELLALFANDQSRAVATRAYDESIHGTGLYELARFGTGAIPFDLIIPGKGRGTIRLGTKAIVVMTPTPQFITLKQPLRSIHDLAEAVEGKFGTECTVVGKAVTLIGMLAREFVFVFHEGASSYVRHSRTLHQKLAAAGFEMKMNPILRVRYRAWDALNVCCSWFRLPEPFQRAFGTEELCAPSFAARWREVAEEQEALLARLGTLRRPVDLIGFLDEHLRGAWHNLAEEYRSLHQRLEIVKSRVEEVRSERLGLYEEIRALKRARVEAERRKGEHWRAHIFEKEPTGEDWAERERLSTELDRVISDLEHADLRLRDLMHRQKDLTRDPEVEKIHERRRSIELEAELKRLRLIQTAIVSSKGLERASFRPGAWWFRMVCPDGLWYRETIDTADYYLEPLS